MIAIINGPENNSGCQIPLLRDGFAQLGHQHTPDFDDPNAAFLFTDDYAGDSGTNVTPRSIKTIFNVSDQTLGDSLLSDRITCISKTVQKKFKNELGLHADVIYCPARPVHYTGQKKYPQFKVAMVGRIGASHRRSGLAVQSLIRAGFEEHEVAIVGSDYFGYGTRLGYVSDEKLNDIYNSVDYVMMLSTHGRGLSAIEGAMCGAIPIVAPDYEGFEEFWVQSPLGLNYQTCHSPDQIAKLMRSIEADKLWKDVLKLDILGYAELAFRPKFTAKSVASRIIEVYQSI